jgi:hypothetical protein
MLICNAPDEDVATRLMLHCTVPDATTAAVENDTARFPALMATLGSEGIRPVQVAAEPDERLNPVKPEISILAIAIAGNKRYWNENNSAEVFPFTESVIVIEGAESLLYVTVRDVVPESTGAPYDDNVMIPTVASTSSVFKRKLLVNVHVTSPEKLCAVEKAMVKFVVMTADAEMLLQVTADVESDP